MRFRTLSEVILEFDACARPSSASSTNLRFLEEYRAAMRSEPKQVAKHEAAAPGSFRWLCERYYRSAEFMQLTHCSARGLRKAGAPIAAENGATEHQLMAIYGWQSPKQAALYTRKVNRHRLGVRYVKEAAADGSVLLFVPIAPMSVFPHVYRDLGYDPLTDFRPVSQVATFDLCMAVGPATQARP